jgi:hypothetical protein
MASAWIGGRSSGSDAGGACPSIAGAAHLLGTKNPQHGLPVQDHREAAMTTDMSQKQAGQEMRNPQDSLRKTSAPKKLNTREDGLAQGDGPGKTAPARRMRAVSDIEEPSLPEDDA